MSQFLLEVPYSVLLLGMDSSLSYFVSAVGPTMTQAEDRMMMWSVQGVTSPADLIPLFLALKTKVSVPIGEWTVLVLDIGQYWRYSSGVCLSVSMQNVFLKSDAAGITKIGIQMFHNESWKPIYFGVKVQGHESQRQCRHGSLPLLTYPGTPGWRSVLLRWSYSSAVTLWLDCRKDNEH